MKMTAKPLTWIVAGALLLLGAGGAVALESCPTAPTPRMTERPLPRPAMIRSDANLRQGPGLEHPILARTEQDAPVTVLGECIAWRLVRTANGQEAWVHTAMLRQN
jgi:SH3-like domain-containing protein